jgi:hypothetical protein
VNWDKIEGTWKQLKGAVANVEADAVAVEAADEVAEVDVLVPRKADSGAEGVDGTTATVTEVSHEGDGSQ